MSNINERNVVIMVLNQNFPDVRVCQEIDALTEKNYLVYVLISSSAVSASPEYELSKYNVIEVDLIVSKAELILAMLSFQHPTIYKRIIKNETLSKISHRVLAVHVHDLFWGNLGYRLAKFYKCNFVIDYHENYPALKEFLGDTQVSNLKGLVKKLLSSHKRMVNYEKKISQLADAIVVVVEENKNRIIKAYNIPSAKITVVSNTKDIEKYKNYGLNDLTKNINIFYHGSIQKLRGLRTLINAFKNANNPLLTLTIMGFKEDCKEREYIVDLYNGALPECLNLYDWSNDRQFILEKIKESDICVIPHEMSELSETTVPNKIFEYMCHGKALLVSDVGPLKRIVKECNSGIVFEAGNVDDLAMRLTKLESKEPLQKLAENGRKMAVSKYNWAKDARNLVDLYSQLK